MNDTKKYYRMIIVDDEEHILNGLERLILTNYPKWLISGKASCFEEALALLKSSPVDLLITDIKMPGNDGLQLIEEIRQSLPFLEVIIISGHDDFQYAKRAMHSKVSHYLLKPIDIKEFDSTLKQIECSLDVKSNHHILSENYKIEYVNSLINQILNNDIDIEDQLIEFFPNIKYSYQILCIDMNLKNYLSDNLFKEDSDFIAEIRNALKDFGNKYFKNTLVFLRNKSLWCFIISCDEEYNISDFACNLITMLKQRFAIIASAGISNHSNTENRLPQCFYQAYIASKKKLVNSSFMYCEYSSSIFTDTVFSDENLEQKIVNSLLSYNIESTLTYLDLWFDGLMQYNPNVLSITKSIQFFTYYLLRNVELEVGIDDTFSSMFNFVQDLQHIYSSSELLDSLRELIVYTSSLLERGARKKQSRIVSFVTQYINENYTLDLSLNELAELANINVNYLSTHFKTETGMSVVEYITFIRLEKAKEMLQKTNLKISDIANQTGYRDVKYFMRIFKNKIGSTPNEYRKYINH